jgi:K+-transporting ATPase A subunit
VPVPRLVVLLVATARPLGGYMARLFERKQTSLSKPPLPLENLIYRFCRVNPAVEQTWTSYRGRLPRIRSHQHHRLLRPVANSRGAAVESATLGAPGTPSGAVPMAPDLTFNIAVSFMTATSWQSCPGETTLSYLSQTVGIGVQSFTSPPLLRPRLCARRRAPLTPFPGSPARPHCGPRPHTDLRRQPSRFRDRQYRGEEPRRCPPL